MKRETIRIDCISDTHNQRPPQRGRPSDLLIHAGDGTGRGTPAEVMKLGHWFDRQHDARKVFVPGNHDWVFAKDRHAHALLPGVSVLDQSMTVFRGWRIWGEPRQPEFCNWAFNVDREGMAAVWSKAPVDTDILVTHGPPLGIGDKTADGRFVGCRHQLAWIQKNQPALVVCGHIHEGRGVYQVGETTIINASALNQHYRMYSNPWTRVVLDEHGDVEAGER